MKRTGDSSSPSPKRAKTCISQETVEPETRSLKMKTFRCWRSDAYVIELLQKRGMVWRGEPCEVEGRNTYLKKFRQRRRNNEIDQRRCLWWTDDGDPGVLHGFSERHVIAGFPGMEKATTKCEQCKLYGDQDWFPKCYSLPEQQQEIKAFIDQNPDSYWIMKPNDAYGGRRIVVYKALSQELNHVIDNPKWKNFVIQRYMDDPLLIEGYKFHIRAYCVVTRISETTIQSYLYRLGQVEFATHLFDLAQVGKEFNKYCHITNMCVNTEKQNMKYYKKDKPGVGVGTEWGLQKLLDLLPEYLPDFSEENFWHQMRDITETSVRNLCNHSEVQRFVPKGHPGCNFQLFGLDILMNRDGKLFLTEINTRPGMDYTDEILADGLKVPNVIEGNRVTRNIVNDTLTLIDIDEWPDRKSLLPFIKLDT